MLLKRVSYGSLDDMYAAIGYGGFTAQKAVSRMQGELNRVAKLHQAEKAAEELAEAKPAAACQTALRSQAGEERAGHHRGGPG